MPKAAVAFFTIGSALAAPDPAAAHGEDDPLLLMVELDQFDIRGAGSDNHLTWDAEAWLGRDLQKVWVKADGEHHEASPDESELQVLYGRAIARYWDFQVGVRHDISPAPARTWAVVGLEGLAPYFFETDVALFIGESGQTALRFEAEYELLFTQRLILTPDIEINVYGKDDAETEIGSGLADVEVGFRLRYEIRREFAPYIGVIWSKRFGRTANLARASGEPSSDTQFAIGFRVWY